MFNILGKETKFEKYAARAANAYLDNQVPLNDSIIKIAEEKELNPDQIKRVVEAANVKVFQKHFADEDRDGHKDVDFDVADPKVIIKKIYIIKKSPSECGCDGEPKGRGLGRSMMSNPLDFFKDLAMDNFSDRTQDDVEDLPEEKIKMNRPTLVIRIKTAKANLEKQAYTASEDYVEKVAELSRNYRRSDAEPKAFGELCKEAYDHCGEKVLPILQSIATQARKEVPDFSDVPFSKVAGFASKELEQVFELEKIAAEYKRCETAAKLAQEQLDDME